jgi:hypothetical protein
MQEATAKGPRLAFGAIGWQRAARGSRALPEEVAVALSYQRQPRR